MKTKIALTLWFAVTAGAFAAELPRQFEGTAPLQWSERLAQSEMKRLGTALDAGGSNPRARWDYSPGVLALSLVRLGDRTGNAAYTDFGARAVTSHVNADGTIKGYKAEDFNIDNIPPGKVLLAALDRGAKNEAWTKAVQTLRAQMVTHPRTSEGGFWHKQRYPHQMWLDGLYMASPFLAQYAVLFHEPALFDDVAKQIVLMDRHSYDATTGLYWHAWDEAHAQSWADPKSGVSPNFWSRAIGWYGMSIVDSLDYLPVSQPEIDEIVNILKRVADGAVKWQDPQTGVWWQIPNLGTREGNYLEASGSAMLVYTLAKGVNKGYLPREKYLPAILRGYEGLLRTFVKTNPDGTIRLTQICQGAGLGYTTSNGRPRDGSYLRPNFVQPYRCKNILIEGVTIVRSPMWELHPVLSQNITVRGVQIHSHGPNNDGCDPESSRDILIEGCVFDTGDDCIAIKSGRNNDGRRVNVPSENIVIRGCTMLDGHGGVVLGSEISGSVRNVFVEHCKMDSPNLDRALRFKSNAQRGGVLENVFMRNVEVGQVAEAVLTVDLIYEEGAKGPHRPIVRNIALDHVTSQGSPRVLWIAGFEGATIDNIRFTDCTFNNVTDTDLVLHAGRITFDRVTVEPAKKARSRNSPSVFPSAP
jgi:rhamnogalacturonyl hydrolase YesR